MVNMFGYKQYTPILNQEHPDSNKDLCFLTQLKMKLVTVMKHGEEEERNWHSSTILKGHNLVTLSPKLKWHYKFTTRNSAG